MLKRASLPAGAVVLDPWNGSGTTTYTAAHLGLSSIGLEINPAMAVVAKARLLHSSEADMLRPLAREIVADARANREQVGQTDPLTHWFRPTTAGSLRSLERSIRKHLVGPQTLSATGAHIEHLSKVAAMYYVALFAVSRRIASE